MSILFPRIRSFSQEATISGGYYRTNHTILDYRISNYNSFDRYFALRLEAGAISSQTLRFIVYDASIEEIETCLENEFMHGRIKQLVEEIDVCASKKDEWNISEERAKTIIHTLAKKWESFDSDEGRFFVFPFSWLVSNCVDHLLELIDNEQRGAFLKSLFSDDTISISTVSLFLKNFEFSYGRFNEDKKQTDKKRVTLDEVMELERVFVERARNVLCKPVNTESRRCLDFVWLLGQLDPDLAQNIKHSFVKDDSSLIRVISYSITHGTVSGGYTETKTWKVRLDSIEEFIDKYKARNRIEKLVKQKDFWALSEDDKKDVIAFLVEMERDTNYSLNEDRSTIGEPIIQKKYRELLANQEREKE